MRAEELRVVASSERASESRSKPKHCAVEVKGLSLNYPIGPYVRGSIKANLLSLVGHRGEHKVGTQFVRALSEINLNIVDADRVGLIGSNGSGKSTLLRAIGGIYPISKGEIIVRGQIGTLLDVSLGFEAESTGRENIYYRGMAMGVSRARLKEVENEIVAFAGLGPFIDLPMRTYSAGMWVRLGFAISTQFSPDVLLIDEIFGAGDAAFQARAFERMNSIVRNAGIVVIATHDLAIVQRVCSRVVWLNQGVVHMDGTPGEVIPQYEQFVGTHFR